MRTDGTEGVEALPARELYIRLLNVARRDVVETRITKDVSERIFGIAQMRTAPADHNRELAFMLNALRILRKHDGLFRSDDGGGRLEKHERLFGNFVAELRGVGRIIAPDADDFAGFHPRD